MLKSFCLAAVLTMLATVVIVLVRIATTLEEINHSLTVLPALVQLMMEHSSGTA
jgi:hypothetical protein